jgi:hypothetical protein
MADMDSDYRRKFIRGAIIFVVLAILGLSVVGLAAARFFFGHRAGLG